jgi:hypothetical protein
LAKVGLRQYKQAQHQGLFNMEKGSQYGFNPYLIRQGVPIATMDNDATQRGVATFYF